MLTIPSPLVMRIDRETSDANILYESEMAEGDV
jgi:hypothetical protein